MAERSFLAAPTAVFDTSAASLASSRCRNPPPFPVSLSRFSFSLWPFFLRFSQNSKFRDSIMMYYSLTDFFMFLADLMVKLGELCGYSVTLRCQLPSEDLDVLVSVKSDEDLSNVIEEYRTASSIAGKELKIRAILSPPTSSPSPSPPYTSSSSSSGADLRTDRFRQPAIRRIPAKKPQFNAVSYCHNHNYYACRQQVSSPHRPVSSSYFPQHAYYWHWFILCDNKFVFLEYMNEIKTCSTFGFLYKYRLRLGEISFRKASFISRRLWK